MKEPGRTVLPQVPAPEGPGGGFWVSAGTGLFLSPELRRNYAKCGQYFLLVLRFHAGASNTTQRPDEESSPNPHRRAMLHTDPSRGCQNRAHYRRRQYRPSPRSSDGLGSGSTASQASARSHSTRDRPLPAAPTWPVSAPEAEGKRSSTSSCRAKASGSERQSRSGPGSQTGW